MVSLRSQPAELLELIVDEIDRREDLLSLALTCTRLRDHIISTHLPYRRVVVSVYFQPFFDLVVARSDLADKVRELIVVGTDSSLVVPRGLAFRGGSYKSRMLYTSEDEDEPYRADEKTGRLQPLEVLSLAEDALLRLPRLRHLGFRGSIDRLPLAHIFAVHSARLEGVSFACEEGISALVERWSFGSPSSVVRSAPHP